MSSHPHPEGMRNLWAERLHAKYFPLNIFCYPMIWFYFSVEQSVLLYRAVTVHRPGELVRLKRKVLYDNTFIFMLWSPIQYSVLLYSLYSPVYFYMVPQVHDLVFLFSLLYHAPMDFHVFILIFIHRRKYNLFGSGKCN